MMSAQRITTWRGWLSAFTLALVATASAQTKPVAIKVELVGSSRLLLRFDTPMQTWDNQPEPARLTLKPAADNTCHWASDTQLACETATPLRDATLYQMRLAAGLRTQGGQTLGARTMSVETPRVEVQISSVAWGVGVPRLGVYSRVKFEPTSLQAHLQLQVDGKPIPTPALSTVQLGDSGYYGHRFELDVSAIPGADRVLSVAIVPGVKAVDGPLLGLQRRVLGRYLLRGSPRVSELRCVDIDGPRVDEPKASEISVRCRPEAPMQLEFSHPLDQPSRERLQQRLAALASADEVAWPRPYGYYSRVDRDDLQSPGGVTVELPTLQPGTTYQLALDGLRRESDGAAFPPLSICIETTDALPQLRARHEKTLLADASALSSVVESVNLDAVELSVEALANDWQRDAHRIARHASVNQSQPVTPAAAVRALSARGWTRLSVGPGKAPPGHWNSNAIELAAPAFDVSVVTTSRQVLAWITEWRSAQAIADVEIELLWLPRSDKEPEVLARGRTDRQGLALLTLPPNTVIPTTEWWLRARSTTAGEVRDAVLPFGQSTSWMPLGTAPEIATWGVTDRPLYRAGEQVSYRLWQRDVSGARWQSVDKASVGLRLHNESDDKTILDWTLQASANGALAGIVDLPKHLTDGTYCVGIAADYSTEGACFYVGSFRSQDMWAQVVSEGRVLRDSDRLQATLSAGYYSGGSAAGVAAESLAVTLSPLSLEQAYPEFSNFSFVDVNTPDSDSLGLKIDTRAQSLDADGQASIDLPIVFEGSAKEIEKRAAFGTLGIEFQAAPEDRDGTYAYSSNRRYARYPSYVGLRTDPAWFDARQAVKLEAVVISASGEAQAQAPVAVEIHYLSGYAQSSAAGTLVGACKLVAGKIAACDFPRERSGYYRLTASSADAAPAQLLRYVHVESQSTVDGDAIEPELLLLDDGVQPGMPLHLRLTQPYAKASALMVVSSGSTILDYRLKPLDGTVSEFELQVLADWRGGVRVQALVRESVASTVVDGIRTPARTLQLETVAAGKSETLTTSEQPLQMAFTTASAKPGSKAELVISNRSDQPREVVLAVMDDGMRAQAQRWLPYSDPQGQAWLGGERWRRGSLQWLGFAGWNSAPWRMLWQPEEKPGSGGEDSFDGAPPPPPPAPVMMASAPADYAPSDDGSQSLDRIMVTGSRVKRADIVESDASGKPSDGPREQRQQSQGDVEAPTSMRIRSDFADTALWLPDLRLAPGQSHRVQVTLPDNLTRWRAIAWSADAGDDFTMTEAELTVGLPLEVRLQTPSRLYPGDESRVASHLRQHGTEPAEVQTKLLAQGAGADLTAAHEVSLTAGGQTSVGTRLSPTEPGRINLIASADAAHAHDAVAATVDVASSRIAGRRVQAGWLGEEPLRLDLPRLPASAAEQVLRVSLLHGNGALISQWSSDLQHYPHRCWEQILSRAVAAALALKRDDPQWPDAANVVAEALTNAAVFQNSDGSFVYFTGSPIDFATPESAVALTAYTLDAFALLQSLGHPVAQRVIDAARGYLERSVSRLKQASGGSDEALATRMAWLAFALTALPNAERATLDLLWTQWSNLSLPVQIATAQALQKHRHPQAERALTKLLAALPQEGLQRRVRLSRRYDEWMRSDMREQCALIGLLEDRTEADLIDARRGLLAGLSDLYAGGAAAVDTQTGAICLMSLRHNGSQDDGGSAQFAIGKLSKALQVNADTSTAVWEVGMPPAEQLTITAELGAAPMSYLAELAYSEDVATAQASAVGFSLERQFEVLRDGKWSSLDNYTPDEGEWVRTTLILNTAAERRFVAVTDAVPGGLRPTDLELSGVGGSDLERAAPLGSVYFQTRQLHPVNPRFYADRLPAGRHLIHYFSRVANTGDYLAAPALAELMYGSATHARTAATRLRLGEQ